MNPEQETPEIRTASDIARGNRVNRTRRALCAVPARGRRENGEVAR